MTATAIKTNLTKIAVAITALIVGLAAPPASHAVDGTSSSSYYCANPSTPWLIKGGIAGYKCFQYSNGTGAYSPASRR